MTDDPLRLMHKARSQLLLGNPFFGTLAVRLRLRQTQQVPTGATDGLHLYFNSDWVLKLNDETRLGFVAHEVMHIVHKHMLRQGTRDPHRWNVACDYAINNFLVECGFKLPDDGCVDPKYAGMTADAIYNILPKGICTKLIKITFGKGQPGKGEGGEGDQMQDPGGCGGIMPLPGKDENGDPIDVTVMEADWNEAIGQAAMAAKMQGKLPAGLERLVDKLMKPQVDWKARLRRFFTAVSKTDYSWNRPNRRFIGRGLYLPGLHGHKMGPVVVAIDTSGSIGQSELTAFASELSALIDETDPEIVHLVWCDAAVAGVDKYTKYDMPLKLEAKGGGGTAFSPVFKWVEQHGIAPKILVYLTDLCCNDFGKRPDYPVLWVSTTETTNVPFGEVTQIQVKQQ